MKAEEETRRVGDAATRREENTLLTSFFFFFPRVPASPTLRVSSSSLLFIAVSLEACSKARAMEQARPLKLVEFVVAAVWSAAPSEAAA